MCRRPDPNICCSDCSIERSIAICRRSEPTVYCSDRSIERSIAICRLIGDVEQTIPSDVPTIGSDVLLFPVVETISGHVEVDIVDAVLLDVAFAPDLLDVMLLHVAFLLSDRDFIQHIRDAAEIHPRVVPFPTDRPFGYDERRFALGVPRLGAPRRLTRGAATAYAQRRS